MDKNATSWIVLTIGVVAVLLLGGVVYVVWPEADSVDVPAICGKDTKQCPDGSLVRRAGLGCSFHKCPAVVPVVAPVATSTYEGWIRINDVKSGLTFRYPEKLATTYITTVDWPPTLKVVDKPFACKENGSEITGAGQTVLLQIGDRAYCRNTKMEGAAGSSYSTYAYAFSYSGQTATLTFTLRAVQCANYDDPQKTACESERTSFDPDSIADRMAQSLAAS